MKKILLFYMDSFLIAGQVKSIHNVDHIIALKCHTAFKCFGRGCYGKVINDSIGTWHHYRSTCGRKLRNRCKVILLEVFKTSLKYPQISCLNDVSILDSVSLLPWSTKIRVLQRILLRDTIIWWKLMPFLSSGWINLCW